MREDSFETPPVPPGKSPFHIRGTGYIGHMAWIDEHFPGGRNGFLDALSPTMREFFSQTFLAISDIDFLPLAAAGYVCARVLNMSFDAFVEMRARHQATMDVGGVYRVLLKLTSAKMVAARLPKMMSKYFNFGPVSIVADGPLFVDFVADGVPQMLAPWFTACYRGYVEVALTTAGARMPVLETRSEALPTRGSFAMCRFTGRVTWS